MRFSSHAVLRKASFPVTFMLLFLIALHADDSRTDWSWHQEFPWVYSNAEQTWQYWRAGSDGHFYHWKNSDQSWYRFDEGSNQWVGFSSTNTSSPSTDGGQASDEKTESSDSVDKDNQSSDSKSDSSDKSAYEDWWSDWYSSDKSDESSKDDSWEKSVSVPDDVISLTLEHDGLTREYLLYIPTSYDGTIPVPLLFNFHGYGGSSAGHLAVADMRSLADRETFLLVYPQGSLSSEDSPHWNASLPGSDNKSTADDTGFVQAMITSIFSNYQVDGTRIYACGYSNGGMMSYFLGGSMSDKIAAIGSVSGTMLDGNPDPTEPVPMINLHGTADGTLAYTGGEGAGSISDVVSYWAEKNGANSIPAISNLTSGSSTIVEKSVYSDSNGTAWVEHYKVVGGQHVWLDLDLNGSDTNELIWDFFSKHTLSGPLSTP